MKPLTIASGLLAALLFSQGAPEPDFLSAAVEAARWIDAQAVEEERGTVWPVAPAVSGSVSRDLYHGTPGIILFLLDLAAVTGDEHWRERGLAGARSLAAGIEAGSAEDPAGLYTGLAGRCLTLQRAAALDAEGSGLSEAAEACFEGLVRRARPVGSGVEWNELTDVIGGTAGIGLTLLWAHDRVAAAGALETAVAAGDRLLELARPAETGAKWPMSEDFPRLMPNFSHGTAGITYFLARLYEESGLERFRDAALEGGRYLTSVAFTEGDVCLVFHHEPEGEDLFYLSWCHGPAGTGRTFYQLYEITGDRRWLDWTRLSASGILRSGIPELRTEGFWNNVGRCCGNAGVVEFFLDLHEELGDPDYLEFAHRMLSDLLARATRDESGLRWVQAEHRVQPENLAAQTGYMQGAAGIGSTLLRFHAIVSGAPAPLPLPDTPFGR